MDDAHIFCIHLCISEHLGCFPCLGYYKLCTVNRGCITHQHRDSIFYGYVPSSEIAKSYVGLRFNFQRNLCWFRFDCTNLHSNQ